MTTKEPPLLKELIESRDEAQSAFAEEEQTLRPFIEEINMIASPEIQLFVRSALMKAPVSFWVFPANIEPGFPPDTYMEAGNVLFTKRMVRIAILISICYGVGIKGLGTHSVSTHRDMVIAACLLHGIAKWLESEDGLRWEKFYPYAIDNYIKDVVEPADQLSRESENSSSLYLTAEIKSTILGMVHSHQGRWSPIEETYPLSIGAMVVHQAYFLAGNFDLLTEELWNQSIPIEYLKDSG